MREWKRDRKSRDEEGETGEERMREGMRRDEGGEEKG